MIILAAAVILPLAGILFFMFAYPNGAEGWIGAILIGINHWDAVLAGDVMAPQR